MKTKVHLLVLVLLLWQQPSLALECSTAQSQSSHVLVNHVIRVTKATRFSDCTQKCGADSKCRSINWYPDHGLCDLNNATHLSSPEDFVPASQGTYLIYFLHPMAFCSLKLCSKSSISCLMNSDGINHRCQECNKSLGMQRGRISNVQITASSYLGRNFEPWQGRLHNSKSVWSSKKNIAGEYLQIDLGTVMAITEVATQGRHGSNEWVTKYQVQFSLDGFNWTSCNYDNQVKTFKGNSDRNTIVTNELPNKIDARYIKIVVLDWVHHISMRAELYGCTLY
ncbi:EGF-like repeat and discoidin I-like domain-containing protein 3 [Actinia tenebrosa]|uniref:EGF-like repeat and discoidin I-like domain-containing protein 3 n=1 Tax=Actinia tenebrosa TaxID=6105 RepID=A0A6P8HUC2_ACTTE|nr:EGF-like repeat and discoidin I-like domain-containing protein 3 [Actinia tenebrosa]